MIVVRKGIIINLLILLSLTLLLSDDWKEYREIKQNFYKIDHSTFNIIECTLSVDILNNFLEPLKEQINPILANLKIEENIEEFKFFYSKEDGFKFEKPMLCINIISEEGISDLNTVKEGIQLVESGFIMTVDGLCQQIESIFSYLIEAKETEVNITEILKEDNSLTIKYNSEEGSSIETINDKTILTTTISPQYKTNSKEIYKEITSKKLILEKMVTTIKNPSFEMELSVELSYINLSDSLFVPFKISSSVIQKNQNSSQNQNFIILMNGWKVR
ncbi:MAG: hypothetical protein K8S23_06335 [Candidatus Cloacimonetes bacterium]|nr:hypothetical protein [Candidatus Cloacimonadota bacterium]